jgi:hypothetical protein
MSRQAIFWSLAYAHQDSNNMRVDLGFLQHYWPQCLGRGFGRGLEKKDNVKVGHLQGEIKKNTVIDTRK